MILLDDCLCWTCQEYYDATLEHPFYTQCPRCKAMAEELQRYVRALDTITITDEV